GLHVTLAGRPPLVQAVCERGLVLREAGAETRVAVPAVMSSETLPPQDLIILGVRTYDVAHAVTEVRRLMGDRGQLLAMQNGVGTEEDLAAALGRDRVLVGTLTVSETMDHPGTITRTSRK